MKRILEKKGEDKDFDNLKVVFFIVLIGCLGLLFFGMILGGLNYVNS